MRRATFGALSAILLLAACLPTNTPSPSSPASLPPSDSPTPSPTATEAATPPPSMAPTPTPAPSLSLEPPEGRDDRVVAVEVSVEVPAEELRRITALLEAHPDLSLSVDLETQELRLPDGSVIGFVVDPFSRQMLLTGTDELGFLLGQEAAISAYEASHPPRVSTLP